MVTKIAKIGKRDASCVPSLYPSALSTEGTVMSEVLIPLEDAQGDTSTAKVSRLTMFLTVTSQMFYIHRLCHLLPSACSCWICVHF